MNEPSDTNFDFDEALKELEQLVDKLEQGELSLEQSLAEFERGVRLQRECKSALDSARLRAIELSGEEAEPGPDPDEEAAQ